MYNRDIHKLYNHYKYIAEQDNIESKDIIPPDVWDKYEDRLAGAKNMLRKQFPFYFYILDKLRVVPTVKVPTMAVDDYNNIFINPKFALNELTLEEVSGVLAHEASHIFKLHFFRQGNRDAQLWNIATDYNINMRLLQFGHKLPKLGLIPVQKGSQWWIDYTDQITGTHLQIDITDLTEEEIYSALQSNWEKNKEAMENIMKALSEMHEQMDKHINTDEGDGQPAPAAPESGLAKANQPRGPGDSQDGQQVSKSEREAQAENLTQQAVQDANDEAKKRGTSPGLPKEFELEQKIPTVDWKSVLRGFLKKGSKSNYTWKKPNKRALAAGYYAPRMQQVYDKLDAVVTLDTSGSISRGMINTFISELISIVSVVPNLRLLVIFWDTQGYSPKADGTPFIIDSERQSILDAQKQLSNLKIQSGGTSISGMTAYYEKNKKAIPNFKPHVLITFTDGLIEPNPKMPADIPMDKRIFLINNLGMKGKEVLASGDDSIVKTIGKYVYGVKVQG